MEKVPFVDLKPVRRSPRVVCGAAFHKMKRYLLPQLGWMRDVLFANILNQYPFQYYLGLGRSQKCQESGHYLRNVGNRIAFHYS